MVPFWNRGSLTALPSLPPSLRTLNLNYCDSLTALPPLPPSLQTLNLWGCSSLTVLPDASSLKALEVKNLPDHLEPWRVGVFKAWRAS